MSGKQRITGPACPVCGNELRWVETSGQPEFDASSAPTRETCQVCLKVDE